MNWSYSGPYFPALGLNTEGYSVSLRIQSECGKKRVRISLDRTLFAQWFLFKVILGWCR